MTDGFTHPTPSDGGLVVGDTALAGGWIVDMLIGDPTAVAGKTLDRIAVSDVMGWNILLSRPRQRPLCPDFEPDCLRLLFCEAQRCAVDLRRGLTGELAHCPMSGISAVATYRPAPAARRRRAA